MFFFPFLSVQMDELTKLLSYKINQLANHSPQEEAMRSSQQRALTPQEVQKKQKTTTIKGCIHKCKKKVFYATDED